MGDGFVSSSNGTVIMADDVLEASISLVVTMFVVDVIASLGVVVPKLCVIDLRSDVNVVTAFGVTVSVLGVHSALVAVTVPTSGLLVSIDGDTIAIIEVEVGVCDVIIASVDVVVASVCDVPNASFIMVVAKDGGIVVASVIVV